jgi:glutaredoxin-related protein
VVLRRNLINTMLYVVEEYEFNSAACFEAIEVLDVIKIAFDEVDIETIKEYVKRNLADSKTTHFMFESGRHTNHANVATIVKIGIALKRLLNAASGSQTPSELQKEDSYDFHMLDEEESANKMAAAAAASQASSVS